MRTGLVYRISGALAGAEEFAELDEKGLRTIIDLRQQAEDRAAVIDWAKAGGAEYFNFPIAVGGNKDGQYEKVTEAIAEGRHVEYLLESYAELAIGFGDEFAGAFERLSHQFPCGFGCAAGKDRTGVMSAYLQVLMGATEETAIESYLDKAPTIEQLRPQVEKLYGVAAGEEISEGLLHIMAVHRETIEHAFAAVRSRGGVETFLREHGLTDAAIGRLREALIERP